jgi:transcriptional regulator with XRE-family HTH domain
MATIDPALSARLRDLRRDRRISLRALGERIRYSHTRLWEIETSRKPATPDLVAALDKALDAKGALKELVHEYKGSLDPDDMARLSALDAAPERLDRTSLDALATLLASERHREDLVGASPVIPAANRQLATLSDAIAGTPGRLATDACLIAGQWAQFCGWLYTANRQWTRALLRFDRALEWATIAGHSDLIATIMSFKAHVAWLRGQVGMTTAINDMVLHTPGVYVGQRAYSAFQAARISAISGPGNDVTRHLDMALDLAAQAAERTGDIPPWHYYRTPAFFQLQHGVVLSVLAQSDRRVGERALDLFRTAAEALPAEHRRAEWYGDFLLYHLRVCTQLGDADGRVAVLDELRMIVDATRSDTLSTRLASVSSSES